MGKRASFCLLACGLAKTIAAGSYFEFLMRRVAVAVIPRPAAAIPASVIALGAVSPVFASCRWSYLLAWWSSMERLCRSRASWRAAPSRPVALSWRVLSSRRVSLSRARWPYLPRLSPLRMPCRHRHRPLAPFPNRRGVHFAWLCPHRCGLWLPLPHFRNTEPVFSGFRAGVGSGEDHLHKIFLAFLPT